MPTKEVQKKKTKGCPQAKEVLGREVSCLECPLPVCLLDGPKSLSSRQIRRQSRNREILKLSKEGKSREELAEAFGLNTKTIWRLLQVPENCQI